MIAVTHILFLAGGNGRNAISGAERHVITLVQELAARGVDTELVVLLWSNDPQIEMALAKVRAHGARVCVIERRRGGSGLLSRLVRALDCWRRLALVLRHRRDRVVHMHMELVMQVIAARIAGCRRLVMTIHNDEPLYRRRALQSVVQPSRGVGRCALSPSRSTCGDTSSPRSAFRPASVTTIKYGVPAPVRRPALAFRPRPRRHRFRRRLCRSPDGPEEHSAPDSRDGPPARHHVPHRRRRRAQGRTGAPRAHARLLERQVSGRAIGRRRPDAAVRRPLSPSVWEGLGLVLLEAMLQDVPIVASRAGAIPEVLDDGRCGVLIDPSSGRLARRRDRRHPGRSRATQGARSGRAGACGGAYGVGRMGDETCSLYGELFQNLTHASHVAA